MKKFELHYQIPDQAAESYIAPQLLSVQQPAYVWEETGNLQLHYVYGFMPKGLLSRLIVRMHDYIKDVEHEAWKRGAILYYRNTEAEVIEMYGAKKIRIQVKGSIPENY